jgi:hypothetical protein
VVPVSIIDPLIVLNCDAGTFLKSAKKHPARRQSEAQRWGEIFLCEIPDIIHGPLAARQPVFAKPGEKTSCNGAGWKFAPKPTVGQGSEKARCARS